MVSGRRIFEIVIGNEDFIYEIPASKYGRRAKYYRPTDKLPKKYQDKTRYFFKPKPTTSKVTKPEFNLYDLKENCFVIKNIKSVNTPRKLRIGSNIIWEGNPFTRTLMADALHAWWQGIILINGIETVPLDLFTSGERLFFEFSIKEIDNPPYRSVQDSINMSFVRIKTFEDTLVNMGIIPDDKPKFVKGASYTVDVVQTEKERELKILCHSI
jgi:hypothetical protein